MNDNSEKSILLTNEMRYYEIYADYLFDCNKENNFSNIIFYYEKALMIGQEMGQCSSEARLCKKLGKTHFLLNGSVQSMNAASIYFRQLLCVAQQLRDIEGILK